MNHPTRFLTMPLRFTAAALMAAALWACGPSFTDDVWGGDGYGSLV